MIAAKASTNKIELIEKIPADLPEIFADAEKIGRIIVNLAINAIKFSPEGSKITIWARQIANGSIEIGVTDFGPGISPENLRLIFERFKQVGDAQNGSTKGFGLGLNIARELTALNLGEISVTSVVGKGSTFSFTTPPNDVTVVLRHYLEYLDASPGIDDTMSVLQVVPTTADGITDEIRGLLASIVRPTELLIGATSSLLLIGCTSNTERWLQRLREESATALQGTIDIEQVGSWHYPAERGLAKAKILEVLQQELIHA
jgi:hypothetical protein